MYGKKSFRLRISGLSSVCRMARWNAFRISCSGSFSQLFFK